MGTIKIVPTGDAKANGLNGISMIQRRFLEFPVVLNGMPGNGGDDPEKKNGRHHCKFHLADPFPSFSTESGRGVRFTCISTTNGFLRKRYSSKPSATRSTRCA